MPVGQSQVALPPRYRVVRHVANGGMASVWAAEDELLARLVAVKVLAPGYAAEASARRRFTREARAAARVSDHPNVVTVYDIGETTTDPPEAFIVMEYMPGGSVADRLRDGTAVAVPTALQWLEHAALALDAAHAAGIVHRDVKPGNLMLDDQDRLAVGDFGIASIAGETALTQAGQVLGTAAYLSPEQSRGDAATPASDRYSLAVVAYELLCGRRPFAGETPMAQARARLEADPPTPTGPCEAAAEVLRHGLAKDPAARPATARAFVADLRAVLRGVEAPRDTEAPTRALPVAPAQAPVPPRGAASPGRPPREPLAPVVPGRSRGPRRAVALAALAAMCLAGGAGAALLSGGDDGGTAADATKARERDTTGASSSRASRTSSQSSTTAAQPQQQPATTTPEAQATPSGSPRTLNDQGYAMLPEDPQGAIPLLERALAGFRDGGGTDDVNYAYALYNLGWAYRLAGRPTEAIPLLEERLRISNYKRGVVKKELKTARRDAGQSGAKE